MASAQNGLPLALQIGGRPFEDALVLKVGDALERVLADAVSPAGLDTEGRTFVRLAS